MCLCVWHIFIMLKIFMRPWKSINPNLSLYQCIKIINVARMFIVGSITLRNSFQTTHWNVIHLFRFKYLPLICQSLVALYLVLHSNDEYLYSKIVGFIERNLNVHNLIFNLCWDNIAYDSFIQKKSPYRITDILIRDLARDLRKFGVYFVLIRLQRTY